MYCGNCGTRNDGNNFCINCGMKLENIGNVNSSEMVKKEEKSGLKIASIVLGIIGIVSSVTIVFSPFGVILSLIGLILGIVATKNVKNVVGIILNSVGLFLSIVIISLMVWCIRHIVNNGNLHIDNNNYYRDYYYDDDFGYFNDFFDEYFDGYYDEYDNDKSSNEYY